MNRCRLSLFKFAFAFILFGQTMASAQTSNNAQTLRDLVKEMEQIETQTVENYAEKYPLNAKLNKAFEPVISDSFIDEYRQMAIAANSSRHLEISGVLEFYFSDASRENIVWPTSDDWFVNHSLLSIYGTRLTSADPSIIEILENLQRGHENDPAFPIASKNLGVLKVYESYIRQDLEGVISAHKFMVLNEQFYGTNSNPITGILNDVMLLMTQLDGQESICDFLPDFMAMDLEESGVHLLSYESRRFAMAELCNYSENALRLQASTLVPKNIEEISPTIAARYYIFSALVFAKNNKFEKAEEFINFASDLDHGDPSLEIYKNHIQQMLLVSNSQEISDIQQNLIANLDTSNKLASKHIGMMALLSEEPPSGSVQELISRSLDTAAYTDQLSISQNQTLSLKNRAALLFWLSLILGGLLAIITMWAYRIFRRSRHQSSNLDIMNHYLNEVQGSNLASSRAVNNALTTLERMIEHNGLEKIFLTRSLMDDWRRSIAGNVITARTLATSDYEPDMVKLSKLRSNLKDKWTYIADRHNSTLAYSDTIVNGHLSLDRFLFDTVTDLILEDVFNRNKSSDVTVLTQLAENNRVKVSIYDHGASTRDYRSMNLPSYKDDILHKGLRSARSLRIRIALEFLKSKGGSFHQFSGDGNRLELFFPAFTESAKIISANEN